MTQLFTTCTKIVTSSESSCRLGLRNQPAKRQRLSLKTQMICGINRGVTCTLPNKEQILITIICASLLDLLKMGAKRQANIRLHMSQRKLTISEFKQQPKCRSKKPYPMMLNQHRSCRSQFLTQQLRYKMKLSYQLTVLSTKMRSQSRDPHYHLVATVLHPKSSIM